MILDWCSACQVQSTYIYIYINIYMIWSLVIKACTDRFEIPCLCCEHHYSDIIMSAMVSQIASISVVYSSICSKWVNFDFQVQFDLEGKGQSTPKINRKLKQVVLHFWSKFGDSSLNGWQVTMWTSLGLTRPHAQKDARNNNIWRPKTGIG